MRELRAAVSDPAFWILIAVSVAGYFDLTPWVIVPGALALMLCSVASDSHYIRQFHAIGKLHVLAGVWLSTFVYAGVCVGACFAAGRASLWLWGPLP
jgi:hypothetical protein